MKHHLRPVLIVGVLMALLLIASSGANVLAQEGETVFITSPQDGQVVSGLITVTGAADFPDFLKYEIFLSLGDALLWGATTYAPVINGDLALLDTRTFADGTYQMIIRKVNSDSNYTDFIGPTIIIENGLGASLPFPEMESSLLYPPPGNNALLRLRNCSGDPLEFDYVSPDGLHCSSDTLWLEPKLQESPICPYLDILVVPCEYRGTAIGMGEPRGATYSFEAEAGKIYELTYPGGDRLFIGETPGHPRASTDTGGLDFNDPGRYQTVPETTGPAAAPAAVVPAPTAAVSQAPAAAAAPTAAVDADSSEPDPILPVTGRDVASKAPYVAGAVGLILFLIIGGVVAARNRGYTA